MSSASKRAWGDDEEEEVLPRAKVGDVDATTGLRTSTEHRRRPNGDRVKVTTVERVYNVHVRVSKGVAERKEWAKFGNVVGSKDESNITIQSSDEVFIEPPAHGAMAEEENNKAMAAGLRNFREKMQLRKMARDAGIDGMDDGGAPTSGLRRPGLSAGGGAGGKYVPPGARGMDAGERAAAVTEIERKDTLRISNLAEVTYEDELRAICSQHGSVHRVFLATDKETGLAKGFAYVTFRTEEDAARALEGMQGVGLHHLIINVEYAKAKTGDSAGGGGGARRHMSGYGQKLAQDTTRNVSYASNLTR